MYKCDKEEKEDEEEYDFNPSHAAGGKFFQHKISKKIENWPETWQIGTHLFLARVM